MIEGESWEDTVEQNIAKYRQVMLLPDIARSMYVILSLWLACLKINHMSQKDALTDQFDM